MILIFQRCRPDHVRHLESLVLILAVSRFAVEGARVELDTIDADHVKLPVEGVLEVDAMIWQTLSGYYLESCLGVITIRTSGGQPPTGLSAVWGLATLRAYLVFSVTIDY
jgi:hypothetical protein